MLPTGRPFFFWLLVCFCDVRDWSNVFLAGDMGKHDEPKKKESSEDSYSEVEEEAAPKAAPAAPAPAGVARGVPKSAPPAPPRNTRRRAASEASGTSSDRAPRARRNRSRSPADPPVHASPARSPSPEETGKGHGASSQRVRCPVCWASVANTTGGLSQHQYFNQTCNAWRYYQQGYPSSSLRATTKGGKRDWALGWTGGTYVVWFGGTDAFWVCCSGKIQRATSALGRLAGYEPFLFLQASFWADGSPFCSDGRGENGQEGRWEERQKKTQAPSPQGILSDPRGRAEVWSQASSVGRRHGRRRAADQAWQGWQFHGALPSKRGALIAAIGSCSLILG